MSRPHPIVTYRKAHGLTQLEFAKKAGLFRESEGGARVTVARIESGERLPSIPTARKLARFMGTNLLALRPDLAEIAREVAR